MIFIANFNNSRELSDVYTLFEKNNGTNINILIDGFATGVTNWSVPKGAAPGDVIVFMCAKEARHNLGMATSHIPETYSDSFRTFVDRQKALYKRYSGHILGCGTVASIPVLDGNWWMADVIQLKSFPVPIHIDDFKSFISISKTNSITYLKDEQWERLKWLVNQKNPGFFSNVTAPDSSTLKQEYEDAVRKAEKKPINQLKKAAEKRSAHATASTVQTKVFNRDPIIAAYVKKRANGHCQLCGMKAPFIDQNGEPYLECHHLEWLSKGGMDSVKNCVALCPNCHRKMHYLNDQNDIIFLKASIS